MDLQLSGKTIAVGGATSGLGRAIATQLLQEGVKVIGLARTKEKLEAMERDFPGQFIPFRVDLTIPSSIDRLGDFLNEQQIYGLCLNAGGPPPKATLATSLEDWDTAYRNTLRWKVQLLQHVISGLLRRKEGRVLFVESVSIKQPIDGLVLSNAFRAAVAGLVKTLSREEGNKGVTYNILAPGYHATPRITAVLEKSAELQGITKQEAEAQFVASVPTGKVGNPTDLGSLAAWLFSPHSKYLSGQTISVDGGLIRH
ncbi:MAG: SDR family oxidoreductase, partial [Bacteroidota bacterium]